MNLSTENYLKSVSLDCVIFGFHDNQLKVLLLKMKFSHEWALPGGFLCLDESVENAAKRVLKERTGLGNIFLKQFMVFSNISRSKMNPAVQDLVISGANPDLEWFAQRFISIGFYALVDFTKAAATPDTFSESAEWKNLTEIENLILDHNLILQEALSNLRLQLNYQPIGFNLLPDKFTMPELRKLYETILDKTLDRRNFQQKNVNIWNFEQATRNKKGRCSQISVLL